MLKAIRLAIEAALHDNPADLSPKEIAARMGEKEVPLSNLYAWADCGEYGREIPIERLLQFTLITKDLRPLQELCAAVGCALLPIPGIGNSDGVEPAQLRALHEFSQFMRVNAKAFMDGKITEAELRHIRKEGNEAMRAIVAVIEHAARRAKERHQ